MNSYLAKKDYYNELIEDALRESLPVEKASEKVLKAMRYSLLGGGKRIRGMLTLACFELFDDRIELALPAAVAIEMVHAYSLIHDDLPCMDDDDTRRGKAACHIAFGEAVALLAGDALLTRGLGMLSDISDPLVAKRCLKLLSEAAGFQGMVRGQEMDLTLLDKKSIKKSELNKIYALKTGKMCTAAAAMGAVIGNSSDDDLLIIEESIDKIGLSFQIIDDLIDAPSTKDDIPDDEECRISYLTLYDSNTCRTAAKKLTDEAIEILNNRFKSKAWFITQLAENLFARTK
ncbi:MAG: polyprenyl synthetase family protein [Oscillospiraceae bacterium]|nr:polyprenyl synthetase family protein [Oscillospiraceae bacterium]